MPIEEDLDRHQHGQQEPCQCRNVGPCQGKLRTTLKWKKKIITGSFQWITKCCVVPPSGLSDLLGVCIFHGLQTCIVLVFLIASMCVFFGVSFELVAIFYWFPHK